MTRIAHSRRGLVRGLGVAEVGLLMLAAAPVRQTSAMSLITPSVSPSAKQTSEGLTTEVRGGHGGGGGWHGGGAWHGGGFRVAHFRHRHFFGGYYPYYYGSYSPACRIVWTYYGPRRVCGHRHRYGYHRWHRWHHWHRRYW